MYRIDKKKSGKKIKLMMYQRGISAKTLASKMGYADSSTINRWVRGETTPSYENFMNLSLVLRCDVDKLVHFDEV